MNEPTTTRGCALDTDGDGNCSAHPKGCPTRSQALRAAAEQAAEACRCELVNAPETTLADIIETVLRLTLLEASAIVREIVSAEREANANAVAQEREEIAALALSTKWHGERAEEFGARVAAAIQARKDGAR